jgi:hypothetical protein
MKPLYVIFLRTPFGRSPENSFSSTLRSDEKMNFSTLHFEKLVFHFDIRLREKR